VSDLRAGILSSPTGQSKHFDPNHDPPHDCLLELEGDRTFEHELLFGETVETVRALATSLGLSQRDLARRLDVSDARLSRVMSGRSNLTLATLADLGWAIGVRFEVVPVPLIDRSRTPARNDAPPPPWIQKHARLIARRVTQALKQVR
jgi:transcriptional regulator with XRE-family HTH domain